MTSRSGFRVLKKNRNILMALAAMVVAACMLGISVNLYIIAGIGSDSITVFEDGLHTALNISLGASSYLYSLLTIGIGLVFARKYIGWTTITYSLLCGPAINCFGVILQPISLYSDRVVVKVVLLCLAISFTAAACAVLIVYKNGMNSLDAIATVIADRTRFQYRVIRTCMDALLMLTGWLMGGTVGLGTIPAVFLTGTAIDYFVALMKKAGFGLKEDIPEKGRGIEP